MAISVGFPPHRPSPKDAFACSWPLKPLAPLGWRISRRSQDGVLESLKGSDVGEGRLRDLGGGSKLQGRGTVGVAATSGQCSPFSVRRRKESLRRRSRLNPSFISSLPGEPGIMFVCKAKPRFYLGRGEAQQEGWVWRARGVGGLAQAGEPLSKHSHLAG